jgi:hypothetical protein
MPLSTKRVVRMSGGAVLSATLAADPVAATFTQAPQRPKDYVLTVDATGATVETALSTKAGQTYLIEASGW